MLTLKISNVFSENKQLHMDTQITWTLWQVPLVFILTGFHCRLFFKKKKHSNAKLEHKLIHRIRMDFNMLHNCTKFVINKITISKTAFNRRIYVHFRGGRVLNFGVNRA